MDQPHARALGEHDVDRAPRPGQHRREHSHGRPGGEDPLARAGGRPGAPRRAVDAHPLGLAHSDTGAMKLGLRARLSLLLAAFGVLAAGLTGVFAYPPEREVVVPTVGSQRPTT